MPLTKVQLTERLPIRSQIAELRRLRMASKGDFLYKKFYYEDTSVEETLLNIANINYRIKAIGSANCYVKL